jgi:hypothetical protein
MILGLCPSISRLEVTLLMLSLATVIGCSGSVPAQVASADVDPTAAAANALASYDANKDGSLDASELSKCPALAGSLAGLDANGDHKLSGDEISQKLSAIQASGSNLTGTQCAVYLAGQPLAGATVKLVPPDILEGSLAPAEGVADDQGVARPSIGDENLPEKLKGAPLVYPGLYAVEITHPDRQIPARYNAQTELGILIDPTSRNDSGARFDLKSN